MPLAQSLLALSNQSLDSGRYRLLNLLGTGGYGAVYLALEHDASRSRVKARAIKVLPLAHGDLRRATYQMREITLHSRVSGRTNVVRLLRVLRDTKFIYLVLEYVPGGDLFHFVRGPQGPALAGDVDTVKKVFLKVLDGVAACHAAGVYHRDLKPENILVGTGAERVCVSDFGLATTSTQSTTFNVGTKRYMCPECIDCDDTDYPYETARSDIWALGLILIFMVVGRQPWYRATLDDISFVEYLEDPDYLRKILPISASLNSVLRRVLTIVPKDALTIEEFRAAVQDVDTFWMSAEDRGRAPFDTVRIIWNEYTGQLAIPEPDDAQKGAEGETDDEDDGDVLDSETSSECSEMHAPPRPPAPCPATPVMAPDSTHDTAAAQPVAPPSTPVLANEAQGPSSSPDTDGPITPECRPQNVPEVVSSQPLDGGVHGGGSVEALPKERVGKIQRRILELEKLGALIARLPLSRKAVA